MDSKIAFLLFTMVFLASISFVSAGITFAYHCYDENCKEGTKIDYTVLLTNTANITLNFDKLIANLLNIGTF